MKAQSPAEDNLTVDIKEIIASSRVNNRVGIHTETKLLEKLIIYIVNRDGKILEHGIKVGKESKNGNRES